MNQRHGLAFYWGAFFSTLACSNGASPTQLAPTEATPPTSTSHPASATDHDSAVPASPSSAATDGSSDSGDRPSASTDAAMGQTSGTDAETTISDTSAPTLVETNCSFQVTGSISERVPTVGIVTFETDLGDVEGGYVEFGSDGSYGHQAPLETAASGHRTLLLGMPAATEVHYRVVARSSNAFCRSDDHVLTTGPLPSDVPQPTLRTSAEGQVSPGYLITSANAAGDGIGYYVVIYNHAGQPVWWYHSPIASMLVRAKLSWDGKYIYGRDGNPGARAGGQVIRVAIDGSSEESLTIDTGHHDFAVTPDNGVLFLAGGGGDNCGRVVKLSGAGEVNQFYDMRNAFGDAFRPNTDPCHCNSIHYNTEDASVTVSCLGQNGYVKLSEAGELVWVLGGNNGQSHFTGDVAWDRQHGHHMLGPNRILFLNNNGGGDSTSNSSLAVELELDSENKTARRVWEYDGGEVTQTLGDVQRLANGNTLVTYCNAGVLHEVDPSKRLVQSWQFTNGVGYTDHRQALYGDPSRP